jgi:hypothetical protein
MVKIIGLSSGPPGPAPQKTVEYVEGTPEERARNVARSKAFWANTEWLSQQWDRLLPDARGKYVAVADREAFVAPTYAEAVAWIKANHPGDPGAFVEYVSPRQELRTRAYPR